MWSRSLKALLLMGSGTKVNHFLMWGETFSRWLGSLGFGWTYPDTSVLSHDLIGAPQKDTLSTRKGCPPDRSCSSSRASSGGGGSSRSLSGRRAPSLPWTETFRWSLWRCSTVEFQVGLGSWSGHICSSQPKAASLKPVKWFVLGFPGLVQGSEEA